MNEPSRKWSVYRIRRHQFGMQTTVKPLGYVMAKHQPDALDKAWKRWPTEVDPQQAQGGMTVRPHADDPWSLGPRKKL